MPRRRDVLKLLLGLPLAGCGAASPPTPTPEPIELSFSYYEQALQTHYEKLLAEFEQAHSGWTASLGRGSPYGFGGTSEFDVAELSQLPLAILADNGALRAIEPLLQSTPDFDLNAFYPGTLEALRWGGQLWGLPSGVEPLVLYYSRGLFDQAGVPYPTNDWTWDDLLAAALEISRPDADPPVYGLGADDEFRLDVIPFIYQNGGAIFDSLVDPKAATLTDPATVEALEWYASLTSEHRVMATRSDLSSLGGLRAGIITQNVAMWYGGFSEREGMSWGVPWNFEWGMAALPGNKARMTLLFQRCYVVSSGSSRVAVAWEWLRYLAEHPALDYDLPPLKALVEADDFLAAEPADVRSAARASLEIGHTLPPMLWVRDFARELDSAVRDVLEYDTPADEALAEAEARLNEAIAREQ